MTLQIPSIASSAPTLTAVQRRLLLICTAMGVGGGAEEQVMRLAMAFQSRGWKTMIVSLLPPSTIMPAEFTSQGIELVDLGMRKALPDPRGLLRLAKVVRDFRPDVVHSHMVHANLIARAVRAIAPVPVLVCTHHNLTMAGVRNDHSAVFEFAHRITDGFAERTTAICHAAVDYCIEHRVAPASKMMVVPNGIDCERFAHNPEARKRLREQLGINDDFVWLAVGRLVLQKAYPTMLRAFAKLAPVGQTLLICGQGILREELIALAAELGIAERVRFLGLRRDIPDVMSAADAFVLSSDMEGLPLVLLQASAAALPIVATNVSGNPEVVNEGVNGYLTPPGAPDLFAQAMARMVALPAADRAAMGKAGLERVRKNFEVEPVVDQWEQLFEQLLRSGGGRRRRRASVIGSSNPDASSVAIPDVPRGCLTGEKCK
jgi:glycosyltransferase involved in cell wall biosynthesis